MENDDCHSTSHAGSISYQQVLAEGISLNEHQKHAALLLKRGDEGEKQDQQ